MATVIVIPARYGSRRYPGKALAPLAGAGGVVKPLIARTYEAALAVPGVDRVVIATDDERIAAVGRALGAEVAMTAESCRNGTERCAEAAARGLLGPLDAGSIVVNLQGDAPLTPPAFVTPLIEAMRADPNLATATPALRCSGATLQRFREDRRAGRVGGTTVVFQRRPGASRTEPGDALYFSKEVVPYTGETEYAPDAPTPAFYHVGVYAYRPRALEAYAAADETDLERLEGLEQLRFLDLGVPMRIVEVVSDGRDFCELNNPIDVGRIERALAALGME